MIMSRKKIFMISINFQAFYLSFTADQKLCSIIRNKSLPEIKYLIFLRNLIIRSITMITSFDSEWRRKIFSEHRLYCVSELPSCQSNKVCTWKSYVKQFNFILSKHYFQQPIKKILYSFWWYCWSSDIIDRYFHFKLWCSS